MGGGGPASRIESAPSKLLSLAGRIGAPNACGVQESNACIPGQPVIKIYTYIIKRLYICIHICVCVRVYASRRTGRQTDRQTNKQTNKC